MGEFAESRLRDKDQPGRLWFVAAALLALAITGWLCWDTTRAVRAGWRPDHSALVRYSPTLFAALFVAALCAGVIPKSRRLLMRHAKQLIATMVSIIIGLAFGEVILRELELAAPFHLRRPGTSFVLRPDETALPDVPSPAHVSYAGDGSRTSGPSHSVGPTILCVGGSTTESLFLDDHLAWPARVQSALGPNVAIVNTGHCDFGTGHHIKFLTHSELARAADTWVLLVGVGDLMRYLLQVDQGDRPGPVWYDTALARVLRDVWNARLKRGMYVDETGAAYQHARGKLPFDWTRLPDLRGAADDFALRLRDIARLARLQGKRLILVTQPVLWANDLTSPGMARLVVCRMYPHPAPWKFLTPENLRAGIDQFNDCVRAVAADSGCELVDAAQSMNGQVDFFYDDYHLNQAGSAALAELVAQRFGRHAMSSEALALVPRAAR